MKYPCIRRSTFVHLDFGRKFDTVRRRRTCTGHRDKQSYPRVIVKWQSCKNIRLTLSNFISSTSTRNTPLQQSSNLSRHYPAAPSYRSFFLSSFFFVFSFFFNKRMWWMLRVMGELTLPAYNGDLLYSIDLHTSQNVNGRFSVTLKGFHPRKIRNSVFAFFFFLFF